MPRSPISVVRSPATEERAVLAALKQISTACEAQIDLEVRSARNRFTLAPFFILLLLPLPCCDCVRYSAHSRYNCVATHAPLRQPTQLADGSSPPARHRHFEWRRRPDRGAMCCARKRAARSERADRRAGPDECAAGEGSRQLHGAAPHHAGCSGDEGASRQLRVHVPLGEQRRGGGRAGGRWRLRCEPPRSALACAKRRIGWRPHAVARVRERYRRGADDASAAHCRLHCEQGELILFTVTF